MEEAERKRIVANRMVAIVMAAILALLALYCLVQDKTLWVGIYLLSAAVLQGIYGFPCIAFSIIGGVLSLLFYYQETALLKILAPIMLIVLIHDGVQLTRFLSSREFFKLLNKSEAKNLPLRMRECELGHKVYKLLSSHKGR